MARAPQEEHRYEGFDRCPVHRSVELKNLTGTRSEAISLYNLFEGRIPSEAEVTAWINVRSSMSLADAIEASFSVADL
ncbi:MAG: hypothetical protein R2706_06965 [Acidimicrobiales bacterium]